MTFVSQRPLVGVVYKTWKGFTFTISGYESHGPQLGIQVGQDGHMWLKVNNQWKRVVTE